MKRMLNDDEIKFTSKAIARTEEEIKEYQHIIEGDEFTLSRLDLTAEIVKRKNKLHLENTIRDNKNELEMRLNSIKILKDQLENGVEVKENAE